MRLARLLVVATLLVACKGDGGGPVGTDPSLAGRWSGSAKLTLLDFSARFEQEGDDVTGTGRFSSPLGGDDFTATGTVTGGDVRLTLTSSEYGVATYVGRFVAANRVTGRLDAAAYSDIELTIDRD